MDYENGELLEQGYYLFGFGMKLNFLGNNGRNEYDGVVSCLSKPSEPELIRCVG
jgi:hypothetical protein